jgi:hypothetical protein
MEKEKKLKCNPTAIKTEPEYPHEHVTITSSFLAPLM